jgi:Ca2+-binding RTX toxin-like protein
LQFRNDFTSNFDGIEVVRGGSGSDRLIGADTVNTWVITADDAGTVGGITFRSFERLVGGTSGDTFRLGDGRRVSVRIDGGSGTDRLDYSPYTTPVAVNLATRTATNVAGGATDGIAGIENVTGGSANNLLTGDSANNTLLGGGGDDILIGGTTGYDAREVSLVAIMREWTRTDLPGTAQQQYDQRISHLRGTTSGGLNGSALLNGSTVQDDREVDVLQGELGLDWFFLAPGQDQTDQESTERAN